MGAATRGFWARLRTQQLLRGKGPKLVVTILERTVSRYRECHENASIAEKLSEWSRQFLPPRAFELPRS